MTYHVGNLKDELSRHEGRKPKPYKDSEGILTIGVGWNLEANGLPEDVIDHLLELGIENAEKALDAIHPNWREHDEARQRVLLNMAFNLGQSRLAGFKKMWAAVAIGDYEEAAAQMLDSKWAGQVGYRATELADRMRGGVA